ncbi:hypothetical protein [Actinoplanes rectilineatus]|uniref:hypothetical protein n=1 Tax=Actinoplanes rectilineatus TaxID=113571 RepID=UPI0005F2FBAC|nr:hypothetical protein [Actinoplanes rectilineatus]
MTDIRTAFRWGSWVVAGIMLLVLYREEGLSGAGIQPAAYLTSVGAWAVTPVSVVFPTWRVLAFLLTAVTFGATAAVTLTVPADLQHTSANWAIGVNGWLLLTTASAGRLRPLMLWLTLPVVLAMVVAIPAGAPEMVRMIARALGIFGLQLPVALAIQAVARSALAANEQHRAQEAIRTGQIVAQALHEDRLRRSRAVAAAVEPVLASLADADPDDTLRQRSRVASTQVRRLLAEWYGDGHDPLGDDLSACLDDVQAAGIPVEVTVHAGDLPPVLRRATCDVVREAARLPGARLRLTAVPTATHLSLSVVARTSDAGSGFSIDEVPAPLVIRTTTIGETLWVELTCPV